MRIVPSAAFGMAKTSPWPPRSSAADSAFFSSWISSSRGMSAWSTWSAAAGAFSGTAALGAACRITSTFVPCTSWRPPANVPKGDSYSNAAGLPPGGTMAATMPSTSSGEMTRVLSGASRSLIRSIGAAPPDTRNSVAAFSAATLSSLSIWAASGEGAAVLMRKKPWDIPYSAARGSPCTAAARPYHHYWQVSGKSRGICRGQARAPGGAGESLPVRPHSQAKAHPASVNRRLEGGKSLLAGRGYAQCSSSVCRPPRLPFSGCQTVATPNRNAL